jgi:hypothetical protein
LKPAWANSSQDPISKNTHHKKRAGGVAQGVGRVQAPVLQKKKKKSQVYREVQELVPTHVPAGSQLCLMTREMLGSLVSVNCT